jgi:hypothetical protein
MMVPEDEVGMNDLFEWYEAQDQLGKLKSKEMLLRNRIFGAYFPDPKEGTNNFNLDDGYVLKGGHTINRDVDIGAFTALREQLGGVGIQNPDDLIQFKPSLKLAKYRELTEEQRKLFDVCLIVKPGAPSLEIVLPAPKAKTKAKAKAKKTSNAAA